MTRSSTPPDPVGTEARDALADVLEDQARREARRAAATGPAVVRRLGYPTAAVLAAVSLWLWVAPPAALTPAPPPEPSPAQMAAGLRMDMWVVAASVERARRPDGSVPRRLEEVLEEPTDAEDVRYLPLGSADYTLIGERGGTTIRWSSTQGLDALMSGSADPPPPGSPG